ncbi:hypothetical protein M1563_04195 [Patescibacteria group bacterium]|nr:hypothetical protein [Patescibacteria group bacterium]
MNSDSPNLKNINTIAYDKTLREKLEELHNSLGEGITDVAAQATQFITKYKEDAVKQLKFMSKLTADLSVALIQARGDKELNTEEQNQFEDIKKLADALGNLQFRINRLIMDITKMENLSEQISEEGTVLLEALIEVQDKLRTIRADINDLGFFSNNPTLANLFDKQNADVSN